MKDRIGEKIGWTAGWIGGFVWVFVLSVVFLFQGNSGQGLAGIVLTGGAIISVVFFAPWRFPSTPYWKLMLVPYGAFLLSIAWAVWSYGGLGRVGLTWWNLLWLLPLLIPLGTISRRKWADFNTQQNASGQK
jgi:threonine/homoserine efflux transporter RhtA